MDKAIVGYENKLVFHIIQHSPLEFFAPKSLVNNKLLLGLSFIVCPLLYKILFRELVGSSDIR